MTTVLIVISSIIIGFVLGVYYQKRKSMLELRQEFANHLLEYIDKHKEAIDNGELNEKNPINKILNP